MCLYIFTNAYCILSYLANAITQMVVITETCLHRKKHEVFIYCKYFCDYGQNSTSFSITLYPWTVHYRIRFHCMVKLINYKRPLNIKRGKTVKTLLNNVRFHAEEYRTAIGIHNKCRDDRHITSRCLGFCLTRTHLLIAVILSVQ